jgi:hypothetical protein
MKTRFHSERNQCLESPARPTSGYGESFANIFYILHSLIKMFATFVIYDRCDGDPQSHIFIKQISAKMGIRHFWFETTCKDNFYNVFLKVKLSKASDCQCKRCNGPGPILQHRLGIV